MLSASVSVAAETSGGLSGTVRDEHGVPQMGAVIELIGSARGGVRTVVTGLDGRYFFGNLMSGTYHVRASASLFRPVSTRGLRLGSGVQAVVNLTLTNVYSAGSLLPLERRQPDEASDDWMWTMRSAASRPLLRLAGNVPIAQAESPAGKRVTSSVAIGLDSGSFGASGTSQRTVAQFRSADGTGEAVAAVQYGSAGGPVTVRISTERRSSPWSSFSTTADFESNPAIRVVGGGSAWKSMRVTSAESATFGDSAAVEVGSMLTATSSQPGSPASRPFGRVRVLLPGAWTVEYAIATDRSLQRAADAGIHDGAGPGHGVSRIEHGRHQAVSLVRQSRTHSLAVSVYHDVLERTPLLGSGAETDLPGVLQAFGLMPGTLTDTSNTTFRAEGPGYTTNGCRVMLSQQVARDTWLELRFANGAALQLADAGVSKAEPPQARIRTGHGVAAGVTARSQHERTGTVVKVSYQWQPERMVTPIDAFDAVDMPAYLGFALQQHVPSRLVPRGTVVRVSAGNVFHQGLRNVLGKDQSIASLAQELPTLQAGLGFTF